MSAITRVEHMAWSKERALALVDDGDLAGALMSLGSDFNKHPETRSNPALLMLVGLRGPQFLHDAAGMRDFIEGFA